METLLWALLCIACIVLIYTVIGTVIYTVLLGEDFRTAIKLTLREFLFWKA
jgi:hypothetical protein